MRAPNVKVFSFGPNEPVPIAADPDTNRSPTTLSKLPLNVKLTSPFTVPFPLAVITLISASFAIVILDAVNALVAHDAVPNNDPVKLVAVTLPLTFSEPVIVWVSVMILPILTPVFVT